MTVCIAARCEVGYILAVSDRMLTSGDIQFEPPAEKITFLTKSICVMFSGDSAFHSEVMKEVHHECRMHVEAAPHLWLRVKDVAQMYIKHRANAKSIRAEAALLAPLGLTMESFIQKQATMSLDLADTLTRDILNFPIPDVSVIIAGVDDWVGNIMPRIHTIDNDTVTSDDLAGFTAIGSGARHAESQFMLARHAYHTPLPEALMLIYSAKKKAEIAPGVGTETDLYLIGMGLGEHVKISPEVMDKLDIEYKRMVRKETKSREQAFGAIRDYVNGLRAQSTQGQKDAPPQIASGEDAGSS